MVQFTAMQLSSLWKITVTGNKNGVAKLILLFSLSNVYIDFDSVTLLFQASVVIPPVIPDNVYSVLYKYNLIILHDDR